MIFYQEINTLSASYNIFPLIYGIFKYPVLDKLCLDKLENYYSYDETLFSINNHHIFHLLEYLNTRPWMKNKIHPFNEIYEEYRSCWDSNFEKNKINLYYIVLKLYHLLI